eukprot:1161240-Pelagomonas_calceolata.AAC.5
MKMSLYRQALFCYEELLMFAPASVAYLTRYGKIPPMLSDVSASQRRLPHTIGQDVLAYVPDNSDGIRLRAFFCWNQMHRPIGMLQMAGCAHACAGQF